MPIRSTPAITFPARGARSRSRPASSSDHAADPCRPALAPGVADRPPAAAQCPLGRRQGQRRHAGAPGQEQPATAARQRGRPAHRGHGAGVHLAAGRDRLRPAVTSSVVLPPPDEYDGGELCIDDTFGPQRVKLPAGHAVIYPGTSVHQVRPVTRGYRMACFFWVESLVRSAEQRRLLYDMDMALLRLRQQHGESPETVALTGSYHNLLRMWADT